MVGGQKLLGEEMTMERRTTYAVVSTPFHKTQLSLETVEVCGKFLNRRLSRRWCLWLGIFGGSYVVVCEGTYVAISSEMGFGVRGSTLRE